MEKLSIPMTNYDEQVKIGLTLDEKSSNIDNTLNLVKKEIEKHLHFKEIIFTEASATVSGNCGPGTVGVLFVTK